MDLSSQFATDSHLMDKYLVKYFVVIFEYFQKTTIVLFVAKSLTNRKNSHPHFNLIGSLDILTVTWKSIIYKKNGQIQRRQIKYFTIKENICLKIKLNFMSIVTKMWECIWWIINQWWTLWCNGVDSWGPVPWILMGYLDYIWYSFSL